jgi:hypothetical protein
MFSMSSRYDMQMIDDCKEIRLALTRAGIATCPEKCLQTFRLVVTAKYIYHTFARITIGIGYLPGTFLQLHVSKL